MGDCVAACTQRSCSAPAFARRVPCLLSLLAHTHALLAPRCRVFRAAVKFSRRMEVAWLSASALGFLLDVFVYHTFSMVLKSVMKLRTCRSQQHRVTCGGVYGTVTLCHCCVRAWGQCLPSARPRTTPRWPAAWRGAWTPAAAPSAASTRTSRRRVVVLWRELDAQLPCAPYLGYLGYLPACQNANVSSPR